MHPEYNRLVTRDRTLKFFVASLLIFLLSLFLPLLSIHTYCENRSVAGLFAIIAAIAFFMSLLNRASSTGKKIVSAIGITLCLLAAGIDVAFIIYATHDCRHMFDQLH